MGERIHLFDITCGPGGAGDQTEGCADRAKKVANGQCVDMVAFDLSGPIVEDSVPQTSGLEAAPLTLHHVEVDLYVQPELFAPESPMADDWFLDESEVAQAVLFRWALYEKDFALPTIDYNQFANGQFDEALTTIKRGQHLWYPQAELHAPLAAPLPAGGAPNVDWANPGQSALHGSGSDGPFWPGTDKSGTVFGAIGGVLVQREPPPLHIKFTVDRRLVIKARRQLELSIWWSNPWNACAGGRAVVDWNTDVIGRISARQAIAV